MALAVGIKDSDGPWLLPVRLLLEARAFTDQSDNQGKTSLVYAASAGSIAVCRLLIDSRSDPLHQTATGATPLSLAKRQGHATVLELLDPNPTKSSWSKEEVGAGEKVTPQSSLEQLRQQCSQLQLPVEWCNDMQQLAAMKQFADRWGSADSGKLKEECKSKRINIDDISSKEHILARLIQHHAWEIMTEDQIQQECFDKSVPFPKGIFVSNFTTTRRAEKDDLIFRLKEKMFGLRPGEFGPLPVSAGNEAQNQHPFRPGPRVPKTSVSGASREQTKSNQHFNEPFGFKAREMPRTQGGLPKTSHGHHASPGLDDNTKEEAGPRVRQLLAEFTGFSGSLPGEEAELQWTDSELRQYIFSNGYIRPARTTRQHASIHSNSASTSTLLQKHLRTLGLGQDSNGEAIRRSYRSLALKYHPDKNEGDPHSSVEFQRVTEAYEGLRQAGLA
eukprot:TRINITY_DN72242_c0_g1_i1.p1 TRINITY_DN72242_c0_g1~~TRINITY_DN72242_c0_g1_i1.p1  ORF type:complete len:476 (-),score=62.83 TRINITY_DN72242_c0_g1_i1:17-1354(-)